MTFNFSAAYNSDRGRRAENQDRVYFNGIINDPDYSGFTASAGMGRIGSPVFSVFDGIGGENFGDAAAQCAAETLRELCRYQEFDFSSKRIRNMTERINQSVADKAEKLKTEKMGCTFVSLWFQKDSVYMCNLGDSRAYRLRGNELQQLSVDHLLAGMTRITRFGKPKAPVAQYLGISSDEYLIEPYIAKGKLQAGDEYLLCSDGLNDSLSNVEIASVMQSAESAEECARKLVHTALDHGGSDNITVIVCRIGEQD